MLGGPREPRLQIKSYQHAVLELKDKVKTALLEVRYQLWSSNYRTKLGTIPIVADIILAQNDTAKSPQSYFYLESMSTGCTLHCLLTLVETYS